MCFTFRFPAVEQPQVMLRVPTGRHRKPAVARAQWAGVAAVVTLASAVSLPAAAVLVPAAPGATTDAAARDEGPARLAAVDRATARATARAASRSAARLTADEMLAVRVAAGERRDPITGIPLEPEDVGRADLDPRWLTADLNAWARPGGDARLLTVLDDGTRVQVTGTVRGAWAQVLRGDQLAWVRREYLTRQRPTDTRGGGAADDARGDDARADGDAQAAGGGRVSGAPCPDGSAVESGLTANTISVYRAVCAAFPAVTSWGGRSGSGDHGAGRALDIMASGSLGSAIADFVRAHAGELGASDVIYARRIWTVQRAGEGWRPMEDRGSATANHYDHVHVSVY